jgi:hypothetical protein
VSAKKAEGKGKRTTTKLAKAEEEKVPEKKKGKDVAEVRENINELVKESAEEIAKGVIEAAKTGQLAPAKYLFEAAGIYPVTEQTAMRPIETSLAHTLLTRMGLPLEPVICDEEAVPVRLTSDAKVASEAAKPMVVEEVRECAEDAGPVLVEDEE